MEKALEPSRYGSPFPDVLIPELHLWDFVFEHRDLYTAKPAVIDGLTGETITYDELTSATQRIAAGLASYGLEKGNVCAIYAPNSIDYVTAFYGASLAGAVVTTVNPLYTAPELAHQLRDSGARFLITSAALLNVAREGSRESNVNEVFVIGDADDSTPLRTLLNNGRMTSPLASDSRNDVAVLPYSSGTTGLPKGVMLTHYNLVANLQQTDAVEHIGSEDVLIGSLPFYHIYGMTMLMLYSLRVGATVVTLAPFTVKGFLEVIEKYRVTTAYVVPPLVRTLAMHPLVKSHDLSSLRDIISAAAPLPEVLARRCADRLHCTVRQAYGMTEASPMTHFMPRGRVKPDAVGVPVPNTECRVIDVGNGCDTSLDELGEVWIRGPQVMKGYLNNPEATRAMIDGAGWLHTGDIGYLDSDGDLHVLDRAKELIKFRGLHYAEHELLLLMVEDIAARREAEKRVRFQALLLDSVSESVVATDAHHRVTFWNRGAEALFGYRRSEAIGRRADELIFPNEGTTDETVGTIAGGEGQRAPAGYVVRRRKDGSHIWTDLVASMIRGPDGGPSGLVAIHRDVTDLKRNEQILQGSRQQLRKLSSRLMQIREEERATFARDLHDELGQALTRLKMDISWLNERLPTHLRAKRAVSMLAYIDGMIDSVQRLSARLRPPILDDLGLEAAIEWQAQQFADNGCACRLDLKLGSLPPNRDRDTAVFRIVQEALTNVVRHAQAKQATVRGRLVRRELVVQIEDDGVGLPQSKVDDPHSLGLLGMRERAQMLGGDIRIALLSGKGTLVTLRVPIEPGDASAAQDESGSGT